MFYNSNGVWSFDFDNGICTRNTSSTILFAYSTDTLLSDFNTAANEIVTEIKNEQGHPSTPMLFFGYTMFANVRFDMKQEDDIQYHSSLSTFDASLFAHPPNSTLGYGDKSTGSDVFRVLQKFLHNNQANVCGSFVYVLVKRYPNNEDVTDLIAQLRSKHVFVNFIVHNSPSGGTQTQSLFTVSSKTNGYCIFADTSDYSQTARLGASIIGRACQFLAYNYVASGSGKIVVPTYSSPYPWNWTEYLKILVTVQDHKIDDNFISLNYSITNSTGDSVFSAPDAQSPRYGTGIIVDHGFHGSSDYKMIINYKYATNQPQFIEVRMYSNRYEDFPPFASN